MIIASTIAYNVGDAGGGLLLNLGSATIVDSTIAHNHAESGGGMSNGGALTLVNSTVANNSANFFGGGIRNDATLNLVNSTIAGNAAGFPGVPGGGGISSGEGAVVLQNTVLALNSGPEGTESDCFGAVTSFGNNLIGNPTDCTITLQGTDLTGDPRLAPFTDDGTPGHGHFPLLPESAAIDAGNDAACPTRDQLGQPRVGICDMGSIEFEGLAVSRQE